MRYFIISLILVVLGMQPAAAQMALNRGPQELEGVIVNGELGLMLVTDAGSMSEGRLPLEGQTLEITAELKKNFVEEREYPDLYSDVPKARLHGDLQVVNSRYLFTVDKVQVTPVAQTAKLEALEKLVAGIKGLAEAGAEKEARALADAALELANKVAKATAGTPASGRARAVLQQLDFVLIGAAAF